MHLRRTFLILPQGSVHSISQETAAAKHWLQQNTPITALSVQSHWAPLQTPWPEAGDSWMKRPDFPLLQTEKASLLASLLSQRASPFAAQCPSPRRWRWPNSTGEGCCAPCCASCPSSWSDRGLWWMWHTNLKQKLWLSAKLGGLVQGSEQGQPVRAERSSRAVRAPWNTSASSIRASTKIKPDTPVS